MLVLFCVVIFMFDIMNVVLSDLTLKRMNRFRLFVGVLFDDGLLLL